MATSSRPLLLLLLVAAAAFCAAAGGGGGGDDDDLDYIIENAGDIPVGDPEGWLREGSPDGEEEEDDLEPFGDDAEGHYGGEAALDESAVAVLTEGNFSDLVAARAHVMVEFYAPWCGHCRALAPEYAAAAAELSGEDVVLAKVDATEEGDLAQKYDVQGFPTLLFFVNGVRKDYPGARTKEAIVAWIRKKLGPSVQNVTTVEEAEKNLTADEKLVLGFFDSLSGAHNDELAAAAKLEDQVNFYQTSNPDVAKLFHIDAAAKRPALVLLKKEEEKLTYFDGEFKASAIADFVFANKLPLVTALTQETAPSIFDNPIKKQILLFAVANESTKFLPIFQEAAKSFKGKLIFVFVERDMEEVGEPVANYFGVTGSDTTVLAYTGNEDARKFFLDGEISLDNVKKFAEDFLGDRLTPFYKSEPIPETNDGDVKIVVGKNLDEIVLDESKDVLLELYAPWCGHCQDLEPTYKKLAKHLRGIDSLVIAKMDGTANEHPRAKPDGYPTILFFPAGKKSFEPITFEGDRTVVELYKFIKKHAAIPFKLQRPAPATKTGSSPEAAAPTGSENRSAAGLKDEL